MKIGIFIKGQEKLYENGCNQQALFVYQTLMELEDIECILFVANTKNTTYLGIPTIDIEKNWDKVYKLDFLIFLSNSISNIDILEKIKSHGVFIIDYNCGNICYIFKEDIVFGKHNYITDNIFEKLNKYDQYWIIPNYTMDIDFYKSITGGKIPIYTAPYVWNTDLVDLHNKLGEISYDNSILLPNQTKYIVIAEANMQITKNCLFPLLICNDLYKIYKNFKVIIVSKPKTESFIKFCNNLEIHKKDLVEYYPRIKYFEVLRQFKEKNFDVHILSHHKDNALNFLHLETLYLNYPLIHNCEKYKKAGYYYNNIQDAIKKLYYAFNNHSKNLVNYKLETNKVLKHFSPYNSINQVIYKKYLDELILTKKIKYNPTNFVINNDKITKIIFQTSLETPEYYLVEYCKKYFVDYKYYHFKDDDIIDFIKSNPISEFPNAIQKFNFFTGAHKADFFRYYFLYLKGGIFLDSDAMIHCDIKNIIKNYESVYIKSNFFKDKFGFSHAFNGFICTKPKSPIIYEALKHMYNCDKITNYQMFCIELLKIINRLDVKNIKIYNETIQKSQGFSKSIILNDDGEKILTHYFQEKKIPKNHHMYDLNK